MFQSKRFVASVSLIGITMTGPDSIPYTKPTLGLRLIKILIRNTTASVSGGG